MDTSKLKLNTQYYLTSKSGVYSPKKIILTYLGNGVGCYISCDDNKEYSFSFTDYSLNNIPTKKESEYRELEAVIISHSKLSKICSLPELIQKAGFTKNKELKTIEYNALALSLLGWNFDSDGFKPNQITDWYKKEGKALLGHLIKNAPETN